MGGQWPWIIVCYWMISFYHFLSICEIANSSLNRRGMNPRSSQNSLIDGRGWKTPLSRFFSSFSNSSTDILKAGRRHWVNRISPVPAKNPSFFSNRKMNRSRIRRHNKGEGQSSFESIQKSIILWKTRVIIIEPTMKVPMMPIPDHESFGLPRCIGWLIESLSHRIQVLVEKDSKPILRAIQPLCANPSRSFWSKAMETEHDHTEEIESLRRREVQAKSLIPAILESMM